jgi:type I restriction enzyme, R subunit
MDRGGSHPGRYYQDIAIERVRQAIAAKRNRALLTLATGTGKTFIAFQIAWKLFHSRWNLSREPTRRSTRCNCPFRPLVGSSAQILAG